MKFLRVTELAAVESYKFAGKGDEKEADRAAVDSMRSTLNSLQIEGTVVIGEGERDSAPMLYIGEKLGEGGPALDIAVDPLEGTTTCALHREGAMSVIAVGNSGCLLKAPDVYMDKIAVGPGFPKGVVSLENDLKTNLHNLAEAKGCEISDLLSVVLKRDRHADIIRGLRDWGVRVKLIDDGDIAAVISLGFGGSDIYLGIGGAPEGVLASVALASIGGQMEGRLLLDTELLKDKARRLGIEDVHRSYTIEDMVRGDACFIATGVTDGSVLKGITYDEEKRITTDSVIFASQGIVSRVNRTFYQKGL